MQKFFLIFLAVVAVGVGAIDVEKCKNGAPLPLNVEISNCNQAPCSFKRGSSATMIIKFEATKDVIDRLTAAATAQIMGISVPFELPASVADVCSNLLDDATCPIAKNSIVEYKLNLLFDEYFPMVDMKTIFNLIDQDMESVSCFMTDIKLY